MSLIRESLIFDPYRDVFLLLERYEYQANYNDLLNITSKAVVDDASLDEASINVAPADNAPISEGPEYRANDLSTKSSIREVEL
jgi:hypothetical protein